MASLLRNVRLRALSRFRIPSPAILQSFKANYSSKSEIDEGLRLGDYPVLPWRSAQEEPPRGWWDEQDRRDKETLRFSKTLQQRSKSGSRVLTNEISKLHEEDDALNMWMFDAIENNGKYTRWQALAQLTTMFTLLGGLYYLSMLYDFPSRNPAVPRQFPNDNLFLERGGDPSIPPEERGKVMDDKVQATYGEFVS